MNKHTAVLVEESIFALNVKKGGTYVDCTFGSGGHSEQILKVIGENGKLISFDCDQASLQWVEKINRGNFFFVNDNFANLSFRLSEMKIEKVDGFFFDLGLSSMQIESQRGFSYRNESQLDMRMDPNKTLTASDIVNTFSLKEMADIFYQFGEERKAYQVASVLFNYRKKKKIESSQELTKITASVIGKQKGKSHPSKKIFQALRIKVNEELDNLTTALKSSLELLAEDGRIVVISYHSLEDRIVKTFFREKSKEGFYLLQKKPLLPSEREIKENNRSRSAKLRILVKSSIKPIDRT